jgi:uncharacterized protein YbjT (DUF2867 family)
MPSSAKLLLLASAAGATAARPDGGVRVLVTGATGRTGSLLYKLLQADDQIAKVRGLVRNISKAREVLGCAKCDASEGIYVGDVTNLTSLLEPSRGLDTVAIAAAATVRSTPKEMEAIEFFGVENQVAALAAGRSAGTPVSSLRAVLLSSAGTTSPKPPPFVGGPILFWKLNAEAALGYAGVGSVAVKPCGLVDAAPGQHALGVGFDDHLPSRAFTIARADVAAVVAEAVAEREEGLRFALCNGDASAAPSKDLAALLKQARRPWAREEEGHSELVTSMA